MKIILLQDEKKLGKKGDIIEASEGYARNYILPKKIGVEASSKNLNDLKLKKANDEKVAKEIYEEAKAFGERLKEMEDIALSYPGVVKTYAIQAGRELRVIVGADKLTDQESEGLSHDIAKKIQDEMTYPGQVKITVIRETRAVSYAK